MATYIKNKMTGKWERSGWNGVLSFGFTGCVVPFAGAADKVPAHWLICDGSEVGRGEYPDLFDCIGETYGEGDGTTTFNLPDFRECVLVGAGQNDKNTIAAHDVYDVGQFKDDQLQNITGDFPSLTWPGNIWAGGAFVVSGTGAGRWGDGGDGTSSLNFNASRVARTGTTTHGKQMGVNYIIHV